MRTLGEEWGGERKNKQFPDFACLLWAEMDLPCDSYAKRSQNVLIVAVNIEKAMMPVSFF